MKLPRDQPFWTSVILHIVVLLGLFLATIVQAFKPKEKPHVFEMVAAPVAETATMPTAQTPVVPEIPLPDLAPVPDLVTPVPQQTQAPTPPPEPPKPKFISYEDFIRENPVDTPPTRQTTSRPNISVPQIDVPELTVPSNPSPSRPTPQQLTPQQVSALQQYSAQLRSRIDVAWVKPANLAGVKIAATVIFDVSASGRITNARLRPSSGNPTFDQSVLAAFRKVTSNGPTPTGQGHSFTMTFRMTD